MPGCKAGRSTDTSGFRCNICGAEAEYIAQLASDKHEENVGKKDYFLKAKMMPFYLCEKHDYLYEQMTVRVELRDLFKDTVSTLV